MKFGFKRFLSIGLVIAMLGGNVAQAKTFTNHFQGRGGACWGDIWIRTKTIQWLSGWSEDCYSPYTIVKKTFADTPHDYDYILYKLRHSARSCSWTYIGLYYFTPDAPELYNGWYAVGFPNFKEYQKFDEHLWLGRQWMSVPPFLICQLSDYP